MIKHFLCDTILEFANKIGVTEEAIYNDNILYDLAVRYAELKTMGLTDAGVELGRNGYLM